MTLLLRKKAVKTVSRGIGKISFPDFDVDYLCNPRNKEEISKNIINRKGIGNINLINDLHNKLKTNNDPELRKQCYEEMSKIPNKTHPNVNLTEAQVVRVTGKPRKFSHEPLKFPEITKRMHLSRSEHLGNLSGSRSYYLTGDLAILEQALINFTISSLLKRKFQLISVPDLLDETILQGCGLYTGGERTQVYSIDCRQFPKSSLCLSGTAEMSLAGYFANKVIPEKDLPLRIASVSRCFRAEASSVSEERGIYRVHQFTKVEMFALTKPEESDSVLNEFRQLEEDNFESLGLHFQTLDMPAHELGAPAYRKFDIEAWMPGRNMFGEISSCSNCTDYQSRRLNIKSSRRGYVHTVNGTACAVPRMLLAIVETYQNSNGTIDVPEVLRKYVKKDSIRKQKGIPGLKLIKNKKEC